jgi:3-methyladenine DNA glycosylase AlkC
MPFQLITPEHQSRIQNLVEKIPPEDTSIVAGDLAKLIDCIRSGIPEKRRISTGRYSIVKALGSEVYPHLIKAGVDVFDFVASVFNNTEGDPFVRSLAIQLISLYGMDSADLELTLPYFEKAAADGNWIVRECASGLIRKLVKRYPDQIQGWYLKMVHSPNPNQRRFVSESLRPVVENRWFHKQPDYALGIIKYLYKESAPYPRTSVGNSLSDWIRVSEEVAWPILTELAHNGDKNSYWIAYRACRNLVKKEPLRVLKLLDIREYKYKDRHFRMEDFQES